MLNRYLILFLVLCYCQTSSALIFDRRYDGDKNLSYFGYPIAGNIPNVQEFYGAGVTVSGILGTETDITVLRLTGDAKQFDNKDFNMHIFILTDLPVYQNYLTLSHYYLDIENIGVAKGQRGINADKDKFRYFLANNTLINYTELSLNFYDYQLEFYYALASAKTDPYGIVDENDV